MARPLVFWLWVGPRAITDCSASAATRRPLTRPRVTRHGVGARTYSSRKSWGRAQPAGLTWSAVGVARSTTMARPMRRRADPNSDDRNTQAAAKTASRTTKVAQNSTGPGRSSRASLGQAAAGSKGWRGTLTTTAPISDSDTTGH